MDSVTLSTESEMRKRFRVQDTDDSGEDLISKFSDHLLLKILSFLSAKDIIITCALSTRWRYLSTFFPIVTFDFRSTEEEDCASFLQRVERELDVLPDTARIGNFHLCWNTRPFCSSHVPAAMSVISKAVSHKVEELSFWTSHSSPARVLFSLPHSLFTCESLTCLLLDMPKVVLNSFPTSICFPGLKTLGLQAIQFKNEHSVQLLLAGCPILEDLYLLFCVWNHQTGITISIPTLKRLGISFDRYCPRDPVIRICTPNLLDLSIAAYSPIEFVPCDLSSVVHAKLFAPSLQNYEIQIGNHMLKLLEAISGVKSLILFNETLKAITFADNFQADHLPTFYNLTHLDIKSRVVIHTGAALMHILQKSPNLQCLDFHFGYNIDVPRLQKDQVPVCLQRSLKSFPTSYFRGGSKEIRFLKYVHENAQVLECISVNCSAGLQADSAMKEAIRCELKQLLRSGCARNFTYK